MITPGCADTQYARSGYKMVDLLWRKQAEAREVAPEIAAIDRRQTIALHLCVRGDEEIRDKMLPRSSFAAVFPMNTAGQMRRLGREVFIGDGQRFKLLKQALAGDASRR